MQKNMAAREVIRDLAYSGLLNDITYYELGQLLEKGVSRRSGGSCNFGDKELVQVVTSACKIFNLSKITRRKGEHYHATLYITIAPTITLMNCERTKCALT